LSRKILDMQHRAIETRYKGYRFRSRLEARWAVFFDALGLKWEYEPEGFELKSGRYLPDFYLPDHKVWVEVKPGKSTPLEEIKARDLMEARNEPVFLTGGLPGEEGKLFYSYTQIGGEFNSLTLTAAFGFCEDNGNTSPIGFVALGGVPHYIDHDHDGSLVLIGCTDMKERKSIDLLRTAIEAARGARFEFGESGVRK